MRAEAIAASEVQSRALASLAAIREKSGGEDLSFTVAFPGELPRGVWQSMFVLAHLSSLADEARKRAAGAGKAKALDQLSQTTRVSTRVSCGTMLAITPHIAGFECNPSALEVSWEEDIQEAEFRIRAVNATDGPVVGEVEISIQGLAIARVPLSFVVRPEGANRGDAKPTIGLGAAYPLLQTPRALTRSCYNWPTTSRCHIPSCYLDAIA